MTCLPVSNALIDPEQSVRPLLVETLLNVILDGGFELVLGRRHVVIDSLKLMC